MKEKKIKWAVMRVDGKRREGGCKFVLDSFYLGSDGIERVIDWSMGAGFWEGQMEMGWVRGQRRKKERKKKSDQLDVDEHKV